MLRQKGFAIGAATRCRMTKLRSNTRYRWRVEVSTTTTTESSRTRNATTRADAICRRLAADGWALRTTTGRRTFQKKKPRERRGFLSAGLVRIAGALPVKEGDRNYQAPSPPSQTPPDFSKQLRYVKGQRMPIGADDSGVLNPRVADGNKGDHPVWTRGAQRRHQRLPRFRSIPNDAPCPTIRRGSVPESQNIIF